MDETLQITHILDASREVAFTWWADAEKLQLWTGCRAAEKCDITMDFRAGGAFEQTMHVAGHGKFTVNGVYDDILVPERICYRASFGAIKVEVQIEFFDNGPRQTRVIITQRGLPDPKSIDSAVKSKRASLESLDRIVAAKGSLTARLRHRRSREAKVRDHRQSHD